MKTWLYLETIETGILVDVEDVPQYAQQGYVDTPDKYGAKKELKKTPELSSLEGMSKEDLETYAREMFSVELDRRRSHKNLVKEVQDLEDAFR